MPHLRPLPSVERSFGGRAPPSIRGPTERRSSAVSVRSRFVCSQMACSPGGPASRSMACGLRLVCDRDRGADLPVDPPVWADRTSLLEVVSGGRARGLVPHPRSGALLSTASRPRNLSLSCALSRSGRATPRELLRAHGEEEGSGRGGPRKVFDSQRAGGYSPLDFPLFGGLCWASWRQSETGGGAVHAEPRSRWSTRPGDGSDTQGEIPGNAWRCNQSREGCRSESEDGAMNLLQTAHGHGALLRSAWRWPCSCSASRRPPARWPPPSHRLRRHPRPSDVRSRITGTDFSRRELGVRFNALPAVVPGGFDHTDLGRRPRRRVGHQRRHRRRTSGVDTDTRQAPSTWPPARVP